MKLKVLVLDYDSMGVTKSFIKPDVCAAVDDARFHGIVVILVTGRVLTELPGALNDLQRFDVVVAENGAVLFFPESQRTVQLGAEPPERFLAGLRQQGIDYAVG